MAGDVPKLWDGVPLTAIEDLWDLLKSKLLYWFVSFRTLQADVGMIFQTEVQLLLRCPIVLFACSDILSLRRLV